MSELQQQLLCAGLLKLHCRLPVLSRALMFTTVPLPKRWCSITLPTFNEEASAEGLALAVLPPFAIALDTLDHLPVCLSFCSNDSEKGLTAVSALCGVVNFGLGSAMNCPATGLEFCIRPLRRE